MNERDALLTIGSQHPAWSADQNNALVTIFNRITSLARETVGAVGSTDDDKAEWCAEELDKARV